MFAGCCWWRSLAVDGCSGASRGHAPVMRSPGARWSRRHRSLQQRSERTCAHGSGGGRSHLSNLCILPAWTRSLISPVARIIPRIFRIMNTSAATTRTLQGMARVRSGQAPAWPLVSDRSARRGSGVKRDFACTFTRRFSPALVALRSQSRLMLEGRVRTLSGPSPTHRMQTRHEVPFPAPPPRRGEDRGGVEISVIISPAWPLRRTGRSSRTR